MECSDNGTACTAISSESSIDTSTIIEIGMYLVCFFVGGPLNVISLARLFRTSQTHKAPSAIVLLRMHLNIADLFTLFVYVPKQVIWLLTYQWYGGDLLCRVCSFFNTFCFYLHSFVIACIAVDRVYGAYNISSVTAHRRAYSRCRAMLSFAWILAIALSFPQMIIFRLAHPFEDFSQCVAVWMTYKHEAYELFADNLVANSTKERVATELETIMYYEKMYSNLHLIFVFVVPTLIIIVSYIAVIFILKGLLKDNDQGQRGSLLVFVQRKKSTVSEEESKVVQSVIHEGVPHDEESTVTLALSKSPTPDRADNLQATVEKKKKTKPQYSGFAAGTIHRARQEAKRQAALIILAYVICWSPYNVLAILNATGAAEAFETRDFITFLNGLITANPIVNPIIYGVLKKP